MTTKKVGWLVFEEIAIDDFSWPVNHASGLDLVRSEKEKRINIQYIQIHAYKCIYAYIYTVDVDSCIRLSCLHNQ